MTRAPQEPPLAPSGSPSTSPTSPTSSSSLPAPNPNPSSTFGPTHLATEPASAAPSATRGFLSTSSLNVAEEDIASPPYRPKATRSTSNLGGEEDGQDLFLNPNNPYNYPPSPAYRSQVNMGDGIDREREREREEFGRDVKWEGELRDIKPKVHYPSGNSNASAPSLAPVPVISAASENSIHGRANRANLKLEDIPAPPTGFASSGPGTADAISLAGTDDEDDESDYDWSGEDDLVDEEAKFEHQMGRKVKRSGWGFKRIITLLFSSLLGSTLLAGILVTPGILIHFYWYKRNPTEHRQYVKQNVQAWTFWAAANLLLSWYLAVIVDLVPLVASALVGAVWGHVSERIKTRIELYNSVKNTFKPALYAASGWVSWVIIFGHIYNLFDTQDGDASRAQYTKRVDQVVEFLFFLALIICAQKMLSHAVAFSFHRTAFRERLSDVQSALKVIESLRDYKPKGNPYGSSSARARGSAWGTGWGTPAWSTPVLEKSGFGFKSNKGSRAHTPHDEGMDADNEDFDDRTVVGSSRKSTANWGKGKKRRSTSRPLSFSVDDHEMGVIPPSSSEDASRTLTPSAPFMSPGPNSPSGFTSHRYPPSASPRPSVDSHRHSPSGGAGTGATETLAAAAKALKTAVLHDARGIRGDDDDDIDGAGGTGVSGGGGSNAKGPWGGVGSSSEAKRLARAIYFKFRPHNLGPGGRTYLLPMDFHPAFPDTAAAQAAFRVFDKDNNGDISRAEIKTTLLKVYKERRFLARSMRDVGKALKSLDGILLFFALVIVAFVSLGVFGVDVTSELTSVYTLGIGLSFIFKTSASNAFDAIMFLFVTHPYDTGDRCFIDDEILVVKKMGLFATVFARVDGTETYYFNSQLFSKFITNVRRSGDMYENVTLQLAFRTPLAKLDALEASLNAWLATEQNRWFVPSTAIMLQSINFQRYIEVTIGIGHSGTWQDWGLRCNRKTAFHAAVQHYCRELGITCYEAPIPVVYGQPNPELGFGQGWADDADYYPPPISPGANVTDPYDVGAEDVPPVPPLPGTQAQNSEVLEDIADKQDAKEKEKEKEGSKATFLGFTPPEGLAGSHLRARKTRKKALVGLAGGGGGD